MSALLHRDIPPSETTVVVVGAGPTGLTLACRLALAGVDHLVVDRDMASVTTARAALLHTRTLEALDMLEVATRLRQAGVVVPAFSLRYRDERLLDLDFGCLASKYPFSLSVPQSTTEAVLEERLVELGSAVTRPWTAESVEQNADGVSVVIARGDAERDAERRVVRARYVVGCDGMHSTVREDLDIDSTALGPEETHLIADVHLDAGPDGDRAALFLSPEGSFSVEPLPHGKHRIIAPVTGLARLPLLEDVRALVGRRGPRREKIAVRDVTFSSTYRVQPRIANAYRSGRVFLAGDAAHGSGPAGAQSVNLGIQDAECLGEKLVGACAEPNNESALDEYEIERRAAACSAAELAGLAVRAGALRNPAVVALRNVVFRSMNLIPATRRSLALRLSGARGLESTAPAVLSLEPAWDRTRRARAAR